LRGALVGVANGALGLVDDDDLCAGFGDPDHFLDGASLVGEEVDTAGVEDAIEGVDFEGKAFGFGLEEVCFAAPFEEVLLAFVKHAPGDVHTIEVDVVRKKAEVGAGSNGDFEDASMGLDFELGNEIMPVVGLAGKPVIEALGEVVAWSDAIVEGLVFEVGPGDSADEQWNAVANGIDAASGGVAQVRAGPFKGIARVGIAKQR